MIFRINRLPGMLPGLVAMVLMTAVGAAEEPMDCRAIDTDTARLACYDRSASQRDGAGQMTRPEYESGTTQRDTAGPTTPPEAKAESFLWRSWDLERGINRGTFQLLPYRTTYFLPVRYSDNANKLPHSPAPDHTATTALPIESTEGKFQISFKTKVWENIIGRNSNLWFSYTQQSYWQMYNSSLSSPFRETDYETEAMIVLRTNRDILGLRWRMLNLGFIHQSNGWDIPYSRSWNRLYAQFGFERDGYSLLVRPWLRLLKNVGKDDNPDIDKYLGNGDVRVEYRNNGQLYAVLARYSFPGHHGALQFDGEFPISGPLKGYLQLFSGYGESLIDYNHRQNVIGIGLLLTPWQ
jgi:phospholipase A1